MYGSLVYFLGKSTDASEEQLSILFTMVQDDGAIHSVTSHPL
jgi:hypothetical protein